MEQRSGGGGGGGVVAVAQKRDSCGEVLVRRVEAASVGTVLRFVGHTVFHAAKFGHADHDVRDPHF